MLDQISLFDPAPGNAVARCCIDGRTAPARRPEPWMLRLVPHGEYYILAGGHTLLLRPTQLREDGIPAGHQYNHYTIDGRVYAGVFVGEEKG